MGEQREQATMLDDASLRIRAWNRENTAGGPENQEADDKETLSGQVAALECKVAQLRDVLGEVVATFSLPANRELIGAWPKGEALLDFADRWNRRFQHIG